MKAPLQTSPHKSTCLTIIFIIILLSIILTHHPTLIHQNTLHLLTAQPLTPAHKLSCIRMSRRSSAEGIGAIVKRHEFPLALAELHGARVQFMKKDSEHGYAVSDFFDECSQADCFLRQEDVIVDRCARGDCECVARSLLRGTEGLLAKCQVLEVDVDGARHMEYAGCYNKTLANYFPPQPPLIHGQYAALHYRQGDLSGKHNGKAFRIVELGAIVNFLCMATDLPIIVSTEGTPGLPKCKGRVWVANDSTIPETFNLFQHAQTIVVGTSSFARLIAQGTHARRFVVPERGIGYYLWASGVRWTVFGEDGSIHHYSSTEDVSRTAASAGGFYVESYRTKRGQVIPDLEVCGRSWRELM